MIYAKAGEEITCADCGATVAIFTGDVMVGSPTAQTPIVFLWRPPPRPGEPIPRCVICGGRAFSTGLARRAHMVHGWRTVSGGI